MNINVVGAGIFSKFMRLIQYIETNNLTSEKIYLDVTDENWLINENMFDYCFVQEKIPDVESLECDNFFTYDKKNKIENSPHFTNYQNFCKNLQFSDILEKLINSYTSNFNFDSNTIGVHVRLCDMNQIHDKHYGTFSYEDFVKQIDIVIKENTKIFIASDNNESIEKLKSKYGEKIFYVPSMIRVEKEDSDSYQLQVDNFSNPNFWIESFLEMALLSKCSMLICRTSNLANASICFSNTIQEVIRL